MNSSVARVCHLSSAHPWCDQRILQKECKSLARAGYDVTFVVPRGPTHVTDSVRVVPLCHGSDSRGFHRFGTGQLAILRAAVRQRADVYHFHDPDLILVGLVLKLLGRKVIYDAHEDYRQNMLSRNWPGPRWRRVIAAVFTWLERAAACCFDGVLAADSNIASKFPALKTELITNVPPLRFTEYARTPGETRGFDIVFVGKISEVFGAGQMIEAVNLMFHRDSVHLHLVGAVHPPELARLWEGCPAVIHHGRLLWDQAIAVLQRAHLGLLLYQPTPAHLHFTGEGNTKLFEYMAAGLPVLYSDFPRLREFIEPIGCGYPVDPTDASGIAQVMDYLFENPVVREEMAARGKAAIRDRFNWERETQKLLSAYTRVLASSSSFLL